MSREVPPGRFRWIFVGLILPGLALPQAPGGSPSGPPAVLQVRWISDSHDDAGVAKAHFELTGKYEIKNVNMLKWISGSLDKADASSEGKEASFRYSPPEELPDSPAVLAALLEESGEIQAPENGSTDDGSAIIELKVFPGWKGVSGPYEEALGCGLSVSSRIIKLSQDDVHTLMQNGKVTSAAPVQHDPPICTQTVTVEVTMPTIELKYDRFDHDVAALRYRCSTSITPNVTKTVSGGGESWVPHANFAGEVWLNGVNRVQINPVPPSCVVENGIAKVTEVTPPPVASDFRIHRLGRSWHLNASGQPATDAVPIWVDPDNGDFRNDPDWMQDWIDNPGISFSLHTPDQWPAYAGTLDEFLVKVDDRPECGCIYVAYIMEAKRNLNQKAPKDSWWTAAYRIKYSTPQVIDKTEWDKRKSNPAPSALDLQFQGEEDWVYLDQVGKGWKVVKKP